MNRDIFHSDLVHLALVVLCHGVLLMHTLQKWSRRTCVLPGAEIHDTKTFSRICFQAKFFDMTVSFEH